MYVQGREIPSFKCHNKFNKQINTHITLILLVIHSYLCMYVKVQQICNRKLFFPKSHLLLFLTHFSLDTKSHKIKVNSKCKIVRHQAAKQPNNHPATTAAKTEPHKTTNKQQKLYDLHKLSHMYVCKPLVTFSSLTYTHTNHLLNYKTIRANKSL